MDANEIRQYSLSWGYTLQDNNRTVRIKYNVMDKGQDMHFQNANDSIRLSVSKESF
jgi:hypothetical protein